jgi:hypothetical protein
VASEIPLESELITVQRKDQEAILLRIKNVGPAASLVCVRAISYRVGGGGRGEAMPHRCQVDANFVMVLPGESYFHRVGEVHDADSEADLAVDATVVLRPPAASGVNSDRQGMLRWEGNVRKARDGFRSLAGGK